MEEFGGLLIPRELVIPARTVLGLCVKCGTDLELWKDGKDYLLGDEYADIKCAKCGHRVGDELDLDDIEEYIEDDSKC